jgi:uncharacterized protein YndB with AHSA1/START domain
MSDKPVIHATFTIERTYRASPARVFAAFADPAKKRRWFVDGKGSEAVEFSPDFRVGGRESTRFLFAGGPPGAPPPGTEFRNDTTYQDIVPDRRIVTAYTMTMAGKCISASQSTFELRPAGGGTQLVFTEQAAFFEGADGPRMREEGWRSLLDRLGEEAGEGPRGPLEAPRSA